MKVLSQNGCHTLIATAAALLEELSSDLNTTPKHKLWTDKLKDMVSTRGNGMSDKQKNILLKRINMLRKQRHTKLFALSKTHGFHDIYFEPEKKEPDNDAQ